jgi:eukaryotic-like serine/threonine-protein kinase
MATVSEATEVASGQRVALKRLHVQPDPVKQQRNAELFAREFHVLSQLEHPRIVTVYDYGNDAHGAYYTMELPDGGDLHEFAPVPWRTACAIARDVCSALSLFHSCTRGAWS